MKKLNLLTKVLLVVFMVMVLTAFTVVATSAEIYSGTCGANGDNLTWIFDTDTGVLTIDGTGDMADWEDIADTPWYSYRDNIKSIVVGKGVTSIGHMAFDGCAVSSEVFLYSENVDIYDDEDVIPDTTIHGHAGSTAEAYAEKYGMTFAVMRSDAEMAQLVVDNTLAIVGETFEVVVSLKNNPGFSGLNLYLTYSDVFTLISAENCVPELSFSQDKTMLWDNSSDYCEDGELLKLVFKVADGIPEGNYAINVIFIEASDESCGEVEFFTVNSEIEVFDFIYGDVNGDRVINSKDVVLLRQHIVEKDPLTGISTVAVGKGADCNGDGLVNSKDVVLLRQYIVAKDPLTGESGVVLGPPKSEAGDTESNPDAGDEPENGTTEGGNTVVPSPAPDNEAIKEKQVEAFADITAREVEYIKKAATYEDEVFKSVIAALARAQAKVLLAETEYEVDEAMAELYSELDSLKSYAMKLYDYYVALLGNINDDAEALVDEASDYLEVVLEAYKTATIAIAETKYLVSEGTTEAKNVYLDVYSSVKALCDIYNKSSGTYAVEYVNAKGKVVSAAFDSLEAMKVTAKQLVKDIDKELGYGVDEYLPNDYDLIQEKIDMLLVKYEAFAEATSIVFGQKVLDLVTNSNLIFDTIEYLDNYWRDSLGQLNAKEAFKILNGKGKDGFYYYDLLASADKVSLTVVDPAKFTNPETLWTDEYYTDRIDCVIDAWITEYNLSAGNAEKIINEVLNERDTGYKYEDYLINRRHVALIAEAYEKFESEIVPAVEYLNAIDEGTLEAVEVFKSIEADIERLYVLQSSDKNADNVVDKMELTLSNAVFAQFLESSGVLNVNDLDTAVINAATPIQIESLNAARITYFLTNFGSVKEVKNLENLFTFASDIKDIERAGDDYITLAGAGEWNNTAKAEIYNFFANEYKTAEAAAKKINKAIEYLAKQVKDAKIDSNALFVDLEGVYIEATNASLEAAEPGGAWTYTSTDKKLTLNASSTGYYVAIADVLDYEDATAPITVVVNGVTVMTIDYFNYTYPVFEELIDTDAFEAAYMTLNARLENLFAQIDAFVEAVDAIEYVRTANAYEYVDANSNGKYDIGEAKGDDNKDGVMNAGEAWVKINSVVSLNDQAAVKAASDLYDAWVLAGGSHDIVTFAEKVNPDTEKVYGGVYYMEGFANATEVTATINTLKDLENKIQTLLDAANAFVNGVKLVGDVNAFNNFVVTENDNRLDGSTNEYNRYAVTGFVQSTANDNITGVHGDWTIVRLNNTGTLYKTTYSMTVASSYNSAAEFLASRAALTKRDLLAYVATFYKDFYAANIEFVAAENNDYDDATNYDFYEAQGYVAYKAVDDALAKYAPYELLSAKAAAISAIGYGTSAIIKTAKRQVYGATSVTYIENSLLNYISVAGTYITATDLTPYTIYDFPRLAV